MPDPTHLTEEFDRSIGKIARDLRASVSPAVLPWLQMAVIAEEAGEVVATWRRILGYGRRIGNVEELAYELADVVISTAVAAKILGVDLDAVVRSKLRVVDNRQMVMILDESRNFTTQEWAEHCELLRRIRLDDGVEPLLVDPPADPA